MREIKFRAWLTDKKKMVNCNAGADIEFRSRGVVGLWADEYEYTLLLSEFDLMQYTGLKDKNGVEIYEGDVVRYSYVRNHPKTCQIIYESKAAAFLLQDMSKGAINYVQMKYLGDIVRDNSQSGTRTYELCEVIGNIYENPDLLKAGDGGSK